MDQENILLRERFFADIALVWTIRVQILFHRVIEILPMLLVRLTSFVDTVALSSIVILFILNDSVFIVRAVFIIVHIPKVGQSSQEEWVIHQPQLVVGQLFLRGIRSFVSPGLDVPEKRLNTSEATRAELALGAVPNGVVLGVKGQLVRGLEGQAALVAAVLV